MRAATVLLVVLLAGGASAAAPRKSSVDTAGLRGSVSASGEDSATPAAVTTSAAKLRRAATPTPPLATPLPAEDGQCRQSCAHTYYRCLSGDYAERCPQDWTLCLAACSRASAGLR